MLISVTNVVIKIENKCDCAEKSLFMFFNFKKKTTVYVKLRGKLKISCCRLLVNMAWHSGD